VPGAVARLRAEPGPDIVVLGSGDLVQTLLREDLVDELSLTVSPIVLGTGKRLFREVAGPLRLELADSRPTTTGSVLLNYRRAR
jgi:dihydrofolate reductase